MYAVKNNRIKLNFVLSSLLNTLRVSETKNMLLQAYSMGGLRNEDIFKIIFLQKPEFYIQ
jgi:hypothetical protein